MDAATREQINRIHQRIDNIEQARAACRGQSREEVGQMKEALKRIDENLDDYTRSHRAISKDVAGLSALVKFIGIPLTLSLLSLAAALAKFAFFPAAP